MKIAVPNVDCRATTNSGSDMISEKIGTQWPRSPRKRRAARGVKACGAIKAIYPNASGMALWWQRVVSTSIEKGNSRCVDRGINDGIRGVVHHAVIHDSLVEIPVHNGNNERLMKMWINLSYHLAQGHRLAALHLGTATGFQAPRPVKSEVGASVPAHRPSGPDAQSQSTSSPHEARTISSACRTSGQRFFSVELTRLSRLPTRLGKVSPNRL